MEDEFLQLFAEILEAEEPVSLDAKLELFDEWDSIAILSLISDVDDKYSVIIRSDDLNKMQTVGDIWSFINETKKSKDLS
jgi:acyl carrier protein